MKKHIFGSGVHWNVIPHLLLTLVMLVIYSCSPKTQSASSVEPSKSAPASPETMAHVIPGSQVSFEMALLPAGEFLLGSPDGEVSRNEDEGPQIKVKLDSFWIGVHEVSYDEYQIYREKDLDLAGDGQEWNADAVSRPSPPYEDPTFGMGTNGYPAVSMTQFAALQYCKWLSDKTGRFFRLPTEAEWEYACRADSDQAYHFGDDPGPIQDYGWISTNSQERYHKVGEKMANPWGLQDMYGNVSEWTMDQYADDFYQELAGESSPISNPWREPTRLHPRTVKGGNWGQEAEDQRCAARIKSSPKWKERDPQIPKSFWWNTDSPFVGFRLVSPHKQPSKQDQEDFWRMVLGG